MPSKSPDGALVNSREGTLYLLGTPIGNLADITLRAIETLRLVPRIAAEDTRRTRALLSHLGISGKTLHSFNQNTKQPALELLLTALTDGDDVALVTDAGMPSVSDPGAELVQGAAERGLAIVCVPGPSAVTTAVALSGLVNGPFLFLGFLARKGKKRELELARLVTAQQPVVLFESPLRTQATLVELARHMPDRRAALCRELTKVHEQVIRGTLTQLAATSLTLRGEVTLVIDGSTGAVVSAELTGAALDQRIEELLSAGKSTKDVVKHLMEQALLPRQTLYARVQAIRDLHQGD